MQIKDFISNVLKLRVFLISCFSKSYAHISGVWCDKSVHYLIHCRSQLNKQFKICPDLKKKSLWEHVSECMIEQGFYFDAETCETKWQDLKQMYMYHKTSR